MVYRKKQRPNKQPTRLFNAYPWPSYTPSLMSALQLSPMDISMRTLFSSWFHFTYATSETVDFPDETFMLKMCIETREKVISSILGKLLDV